MITTTRRGLWLQYTNERDRPITIAPSICQDGRRTLRSTGTSDKRKAMRICLEWENASRIAKEGRLTDSRSRQVISDIYAIANSEDLPSSSVKEYLESWLTRKKLELSDRSHSDYSKAVKDLLSCIGAKAKKPMDALTVKDAIKFRGEQSKRVRGVTVNKYLKILRGAWTTALKEGIARENIFSRVGMVKEKGRERRAFTLNELQEILAACNEEWRSMVLFGLYTGQRLSDIASLTWEQIDLQNAQMSLTTGKTGRKTTLPLAKPLLKLLMKMPSTDKPDSPLFPEAFKTVQVNQSTLSRQFSDILASIGLGLGWGARGADCFMEYVEDYARVMKQEFLSFDAYPIAKIPDDVETSHYYKADCGVEWPELNAYYRDRYWEAWETYRMVGWKYNLPLWGFVLATPHYHSLWRYGPVTEGTIRLEAFTGLAYGIHALQCFTLPTVPRENWDDGILTFEGKPSARYEHFKTVNRDVSALGPIIMGLTCTRVFHTGPLTSNCCRWNTVRSERDSSHRGIARIEGDPVIVGFLKGNDKRYMMIVNRNPGRAGRVVVKMQNGWKAVEVSKRDGITETPVEASFHVDFEPGDGRLFRFEQQND